jgi:predicted dehydrogenase
MSAAAGAGNSMVLRVGLIGCGKIADAHVEQVHATARGRILAVCDREALMAEQLATRFGIARCYTDLGEMLGAERLDVLHVATPPDSHLPIAEQGFAAGCHVFVEKPFALTRGQAQRIVEAAAAAGRQVCVNYLYNFESPALELERFLAAGRLGDIVHLDAAYGYDLSGDYGLTVLSNPAHWVHRLPGKLFHNVLDHVLSKIVPFISDDYELSVVSLRRRPPSADAIVNAMDDELRFLIRSGSVTASGVVSAHAFPVMHLLRIMGTRDSFELDFAARTIVPLARQIYPSALGRLQPAFTQARKFLQNGRRNIRAFRRHEFHYFQCMRVLLQRFYDAVEFGAPAPVPVEQTVRVCGLIEAIGAAAASDRGRA